MSNTDTKYQISSFAAPTDEDVAYFNSLSEHERRSLMHTELEKGFEGEPMPLTDKLMRQVFQDALNEVSMRYADR